MAAANFTAAAFIAAAGEADGEGWLGPARVGRRLGLPSRGLGLGRWLGRRLLELRLGGGWGWGWDPGWAIAAATVPVRVAIASQPAFDSRQGCWVRRRVWDAGGHYLGRRLVNICY
jgi:hypothetical protein